MYIICSQVVTSVMRKWDGPEPTEWKVTKLPANGPKKGQSVRSWEAGKRMGDADWAKQRAKAIDEGKL